MGMLRTMSAAIALTTILLCSLGVSRAGAGPATGACCLPDHSCAGLIPSECESAGGNFISFDSSCATITCDVGAAPLLSGALLLLVAALLAAVGWIARSRASGASVERVPPQT